MPTPHSPRAELDESEKRRPTRRCRTCRRYRSYARNDDVGADSLRRRPNLIEGLASRGPDAAPASSPNRQPTPWLPLRANRESPAAPGFEDAPVGSRAPPTFPRPARDPVVRQPPQQYAPQSKYMYVLPRMSQFRPPVVPENWMAREQRGVQTVCQVKSQFLPSGRTVRNLWRPVKVISS